MARHATSCTYSLVQLGPHSVQSPLILQGTLLLMLGGPLQSFLLPPELTLDLRQLSLKARAFLVLVTQLLLQGLDGEKTRRREVNGQKETSSLAVEYLYSDVERLYGPFSLPYLVVELFGMYNCFLLLLQPLPQYLVGGLCHS